MITFHFCVLTSAINIATLPSRLGVPADFLLHGLGNCEDLTDDKQSTGKIQSASLIHCTEEDHDVPTDQQYLISF